MGLPGLEPRAYCSSCRHSNHWATHPHSLNPPIFPLSTCTWRNSNPLRIRFRQNVQKENILRKGEFSRFQQFPFFPQCFQKPMTMDS